MGKAKKIRQRARKPLNPRPPQGDPRRPETWGLPVDARGELTRPKPKRCSIQVMEERRLITGDEYRAAMEIQRVYVAMCAGLFAKPAKLDGPRLGRPEMAEWLADAYGARYRPWADFLSAQHVLRHTRALETVIDVVVEGMTVSEVDRRNQWRHGRAADLLRYALGMYAQMAGWQRQARVEVPAA